MTTVTISITGENVTSTVEGIGKEELQKVLDKLQDGLQWQLIVKSKAPLSRSNIDEKPVQQNTNGNVYAIS